MYILILTIVSVIGAVAVSKGRALTANMIWSVSNPLLAIYNFQLGQVEIAGMFSVYTIIAWYGVYNLKRKVSIKWNAFSPVK